VRHQRSLLDEEIQRRLQLLRLRMNRPGDGPLAGDGEERDRVRVPGPLRLPDVAVRDRQLTVTGTKEEIMALLKSLLGVTS